MTDYNVERSGKKTRIVKRQKRMNELVIDGNSLFIFGERNTCRLWVASLVENPYFEHFILSLIALNSLFLALEEPKYEGFEPGSPEEIRYRYNL